MGGDDRCGSQVAHLSSARTSAFTNCGRVVAYAQGSTGQKPPPALQKDREDLRL
jgi:hypothetical protein